MLYARDGPEAGLTCLKSERYDSEQARPGIIQNSPGLFDPTGTVRRLQECNAGRNLT